MACIRIVDSWLRSPAASPVHQRAVMVVAEAWAEQRVLMRAYAHCPDQTRPTIVLHGVQLAMGPAGVDAHGPWGIHVEPPADGRAQALRAQLELAARRLAGSKGNPPRLMDEVSSFDRKRTNHWVPGTPPDLAPEPGHLPGGRYYEPSEHVAASMSQPGPPPPQPYPYVPPASASAPTSAYYLPAQPAPYLPASPYPPAQPAPYLPAAAPPRPGTTTAHGHAGGAGATWPVHRHPVTAQECLAVLLGGSGIPLTEVERDVLTMLGSSTRLSASQVARLAGTGDGAAWMADLIARLTNLGFDIIAPGAEVGGEPSYVLRR